MSLNLDKKPETLTLEIKFCIMYASMSAREKKENLLSSWKEIAAYLDCNERTCRRWEKRYGLPVCRIDLTSKTRVYSYKEELDKWLRERFNSKSVSQSRITRHFRLNKKIYLFLFIILFGIASIAFVVIKTSKISTPADFRIENSKLIILDQKGKELWRYDTEIKNLLDENEYRSHFQIRRRNVNPPFDMLLPYLIIEDINQDGKKEVLFCTHTQDRYGGGFLFCFGHKGDLLWRFKAGRKIKFGQKNYSSDFWIRGFITNDFDHDGRHGIVLISNAVGFFPTQLVFLNAEGKILGEYWNSGQFSGLILKDINADGKKEIIVPGINNEYGKACLLVFDSTLVNGSSPQNNPEFICEELEAGSEIYYILFPRTEVDLIEYPLNSITEIALLDDEKILVTTDISAIIYIFNYDLQPEEVRLSHTFKKKYKTLQLEGIIEKELNEQECKKTLMNGILYYDGEKWTYRHAMSNPWEVSDKY